MNKCWQGCVIGLNTQPEELVWLFDGGHVSGNRRRHQQRPRQTAREAFDEELEVFVGVSHLSVRRRPPV